MFCFYYPVNSYIYRKERASTVGEEPAKSVVAGALSLEEVLLYERLLKCGCWFIGTQIVTYSLPGRVGWKTSKHAFIKKQKLQFIVSRWQNNYIMIMSQAVCFACVVYDLFGRPTSVLVITSGVGGTWWVHIICHFICEAGFKQRGWVGSGIFLLTALLCLNNRCSVPVVSNVQCQHSYGLWICTNSPLRLFAAFVNGW